MPFNPFGGFDQYEEDLLESQQINRFSTQRESFLNEAGTLDISDLEERRDIQFDINETLASNQLGSLSSDFNKSLSDLRDTGDIALSKSGFAGGSGFIDESIRDEESDLGKSFEFGEASIFNTLAQSQFETNIDFEESFAQRKSDFQRVSDEILALGGTPGEEKDVNIFDSFLAGIFG